MQSLSSSETPWEVESLPLKLLEVLRHKLDGTPVELPPINLPQAVPDGPPDASVLGLVDKAEVALQLQDRYVSTAACACLPTARLGCETLSS